MGLFGFKKDKPPKDTDSVAFKRYMAEKLNGKHIRYVLEKEADYTERIIGRDGFLSISGDEFLVVGSGDVLFRAKIDSLSAWEFLSLQGVTLTAFDLIQGRERTVLAYYVYHR